MKQVLTALQPMLTIIESPLFTKLWPDYWSVEEHSARHGQARWRARHLHRAAQIGAVVLLTINSKSAQDNIPSHVLRKIAEELDHD